MSDTKRGRRATNRGERTTESARPKRVPMSGRRLRMEVPEEIKDPNFYYYWFNDDNDDIARAIAAGFEHVRESGVQIGVRTADSAKSDSSVVSMSVGQGITAYLMRQPMEYRLEDVAAQQAIVNQSEEAMKNELNSETNGRYGKVDIT